MLTLLLLAAAPCESFAGVKLEQQAAACALERSAEPVAVGDREALEQLYERPEFRGAARRNNNLLQFWRHRLGLWLLTLFESEGAASFSSYTRLAVLIGAGAAVLAALAWLVTRRRRRRHERAASVQSPPLEPSRPDALLTEAKGLVQSAPREAVRAALMALLDALAARRLTRLDRVNTNREIVRELASHGAPPELVTAVEGLMRWYDLAFYSLSVIDPRDAARFIDDVGALVSAKSEGAAR